MITGTVSLKIILTGLMALSDAQDGKVATMVEAENHEVQIYLMEGEYLPDSTPPSGKSLYDRFDYWGIPEEAVLWIEDAAGDVTEVRGLSPRLLWDGLAEEEVYVPRQSDENRDLFWVLSIDRIVRGRTSLRGGCALRDEPCPGSVARLFLANGEISACHIIHVHEHYTEDDPCSHLGEVQLPTETLFTYRTANHGRRAIANSLLFESEITTPVVLRWKTPDGVEGKVILGPVGDKLTLVVGNHAPAMATGSPVPPKRLNHFDTLYNVSDQWFTRWWSSHDPSAGEASQFEASPGICETYLECLWGPQDFKSGTAVPESPSECDVATYP